VRKTSCYATSSCIDRRQLHADRVADKNPNEVAARAACRVRDDDVPVPELDAIQRVRQRFPYDAGGLSIFRSRRAAVFVHDRP
jgi:hypothetical protein